MTVGRAAPCTTSRRGRRASAAACEDVTPSCPPRPRPRSTTPSGPSWPTPGSRRSRRPGTSARPSSRTTLLAARSAALGRRRRPPPSADVLGQAERLAAELWGADWCRFCVNGSTQGNQALALAVGRPGDRVVVSRNLHKSLFIGLVLAGLEPVWVRPDIDPETGLALAVPVERVAAALAATPGRARRLPRRAELRRRHERRARRSRTRATRPACRSLVDQAWGAHLGFHPDLPPNALALGADAMVTSAHKTLAGFTQSAYLFARGDRLDAAGATQGFDALHTTSVVRRDPREPRPDARAHGRSEARSSSAARSRSPEAARGRLAPIEGLRRARPRARRRAAPTTRRSSSSRSPAPAPTASRSRPTSGTRASGSSSRTATRSSRSSRSATPRRASSGSSRRSSARSSGGVASRGRSAARARSGASSPRWR